MPPLPQPFRRKTERAVYEVEINENKFVALSLRDRTAAFAINVNDTIAFPATERQGYLDAELTVDSKRFQN